MVRIFYADLAFFSFKNGGVLNILLKFAAVKDEIRSNVHWLRILENSQRQYGLTTDNIGKRREKCILSQQMIV